ncbi:hypothetical protein ACU6U9_11270 [Pseudomonas sp. HK3]|jgi:hypothetical protein
MAKRSPIAPSRFKAKYDKLNSTTKSLLFFILIVSVLIGLGLVYHFNSPPSLENAQRFFEQRKSVEEYHAYKEEEESAKKRAEKNIFLQN